MLLDFTKDELETIQEALFSYRMTESGFLDKEVSDLISSSENKISDLLKFHKKEFPEKYAANKTSQQ